MKPREFEHYIKYMGSKTKLMDSLVERIDSVYDGGGVCDLFAGSCTLSGAIGREVKMFSNDIQSYSAVLADTYLTCYRDSGLGGAQLISRAEYYVEQLRAEMGSLERTDIYDDPDLAEFIAHEEASRLSFQQNFQFSHHLFTKNYSGTWWSREQCFWIDAIKKLYDEYRRRPESSLILSSLMYAMAYCSQGTGHYAQYRDAKDPASLKDILIYRRRSLPEYFIRKFDQALASLPDKKSSLEHEITSLDYQVRLSSLPSCTVYADPPYCFVHYSRFYHAIETLTLYDYPGIQERGGRPVKGRYREARHQSPFSIRSKVPGAFRAMFEGVARSESNLVLSYANTGMISIEDLLALMKISLTGYQVETSAIDYNHKTMGRKGDYQRGVKEYLITAARVKNSIQGQSKRCTVSDHR